MIVPSRTQWRYLHDVAEANETGRLALTSGPARTARVLEERGWVSFVGRAELVAELLGQLPRRRSRDSGYMITADGREALARAERRYIGDLAGHGPGHSPEPRRRGREDRLVK